MTQPTPPGPNPDPTKNVLDLVEAAVLRLDDLRNADGVRFDQDTKWQQREADLRAKHAAEMREAEAKRIDANRAADLAEARLSNERATTTATVLAATQAATAETLRALVANTERATSERISALERSSYEGHGKSAVADPMLADLVGEMKLMRSAATLTTGKGQGVAMSWQIIVVVVGLLVAAGAYFR